MTSPATSDYPWGWSHMPFAQWEPLVIYPSEETCDKSLRNAQNVTQSPVACVPAHDLRLGEQTAASSELARLIETANGPSPSDLAVVR
jgi:hypothetical protein